MKDDFEELRRREAEIQEKQLTAQRVTAAASVVNALATADQAATLAKMGRAFQDAAEATAKHQREVAEATAEHQREIADQQSEMAEHQREIAEHQREMADLQCSMAENQSVTNFRNTILTTLPLLKEEDKAQYFAEQLLPRVKNSAQARINLKFLVLSEILQFPGLSEFALTFARNNPIAQQLLAAGT